VGTRAWLSMPLSMWGPNSFFISIIYCFCQLLLISKVELSRAVSGRQRVGINQELLLGGNIFIQNMCTPLGGLFLFAFYLRPKHS